MSLGKKKILLFSLVFISLACLVWVFIPNRQEVVPVSGTLQPEPSEIKPVPVDSTEIIRKQDSINREERRRKWEEEYLATQITDSITYESEPLIPTHRAKQLRPVLKKWLSFHGIEINLFRLYDEYELDAERFLSPEDPQSIYNRGFDEEFHARYIPQQRDYSPDRSRYINLLETTYVYQDKEDGNWYWLGSDDCQEIRLIDLNRKTDRMFMFTGTSFIHGVFWESNDTFILCKTDNIGNNWYHHFFIYDLENEVYQCYRLRSFEQGGDYLTYDIQSRGILTEYPDY